jgi:radical SAM protein with 4Fe4S-binding SPASM domain
MTKDNYEPLLLGLQWHVTTNCSNRCKHCYMYDEKTYENERKNTLSFDGLIKVLDSLKAFEDKYNAKFNNLTFSGGDPLLREDIFKFFEEVNKRKIKISLLGNPETLTESNVKKLKDLNVSSFQMSLDGLEDTHDFFRAKGSFKRTVEKTKLLKKYKIRCNIMFTLFPNNASDLIPLMNYVAEHTDATSFSFDIGCFVGEGKNLSNNFTSKDLHTIFTNYLIEKNKLEKKYTIGFTEKSNLHKIIRLENSLITPNFVNSTPVISGCYNGWYPPSILSDGTALVCRRLPIEVGKLPENSFEDIFLGNVTLKKYRRRSYFTGCKNCDLYSICRGCPANVYSLTQDPFGKSPLCFREDIKKDQIKNSSTYEEPSLNTTYQEEWDFIASHLRFSQNYSEYLKNKDFQFIYVELAQEENKKEEFLKNPAKYVKDYNYNLSEDQIGWLKHLFGENFIFKNYNIKMDEIARQASEKIVNDIYCSKS